MSRRQDGFAVVRQRRYWPAMALITVGVYLRVWLWARGEALWLDEQMIAGNIRRHALGALWGRLDDEQSAPLGWLAIQRIVLVAAGEGERALRIQPLLWSLATLVVVWLIGRRWLPTLGLTVFIALFALSPTLLAFSAQVKHYSADVFWVCVLLLLAGRVAEQPADRRRAAMFWAAGVIGLWLSMGAFLALPALAVVLAVQVWIRGRWRAGWPHVAGGAVFVAAMAANYVLVLRYAVGSEYLHGFWSGKGYPPYDGGLLATAKWFALTVARLSESPFGLVDLNFTGAGRLMFGVAALFWLLAVAGLVAAVRHRTEFGLLLLALLACPVVLAMVHLVPLASRLAMWTMPFVFIAVAAGIEVAAPMWKRAAGRQRAQRPGNVVLQAAIGVASLALLPALTLQLVRSSSLAFGPPALNDREAIAWMIDQHRPGDLVLYVSSATRAAEWYDRQNRLTPARTVITVPATPDCNPVALAQTVNGFHRVIVYSGVRYVPYLETPQILSQELATLGRVVQTRNFGTSGKVDLIQLQRPLPPSASPASPQCLVIT